MNLLITEQHDDQSIVVLWTAQERNYYKKIKNTGNANITKWGKEIKKRNKTILQVVPTNDLC